MGVIEKITADDEQLDRDETMPNGQHVANIPVKESSLHIEDTDYVKNKILRKVSDGFFQSIMDNVAAKIQDDEELTLKIVIKNIDVTKEQLQKNRRPAYQI